MILHDCNRDLWLFGHLLHTCTLLMSPPFLKLDSKMESELKEDEEDYAMNSESYLEVRLIAS